MYAPFTFKCESFSLENHLKRRKINDSELTQYRAGHSNQKHFVCKKSDGEDGFRLRAAAERVKHVKENEASERHGCVAFRYLLVAHFPFKHPQSASDDYKRREQYIDYNRSGNHRLFYIARFLLHHVFINRLHAQARNTTTKNPQKLNTVRRGKKNIPLSWRPIHDYINPQNLHSVEWIWDPHQRRQSN